MDTELMELRAWYDFRLHCWLDPEPRPKRDNENENEEDWDEYAEWHENAYRDDPESGEIENETDRSV